MEASWPPAAFSDLADNFDAKRVPIQARHRRPGPYPYYGASGVVDSVDGYLFDGEYLLIAEDGENLRTQHTPVAFLATGKFWVNNHAHIARANARADTRFLMYALRVADIRGYLTGSAMPKLTQQSLSRIRLPVPPITEQRAIAAILGAFDDKIELNRRMAQTLEAMARALFKSWFVDFDPVRAKAAGRHPGLPQPLADLFPSSFQNSDLGPIPKGWKVGNIYDAASVIYGAAYSSSKFNRTGEGLPLIRIRDLRDQQPDIYTVEVHPKAYRVRPGDIVVGMDGEFRAWLWTGAPALLNQRLCVFSPLEGVSTAFVLAAIEPLLSAVEASEAATTVIHLGKSDIDGFYAIHPSKEILVAFASASQPLLDRLVSARRESRTLAALRDTLLPKLISGEIRVREAEKLAAKAL